MAARIVLDKPFGIKCGMRDIAPSSARDSHLGKKLTRFLEHNDGKVGILCRAYHRCKNASRSSPNDIDIFVSQASTLESCSV
jgi:hypothetical protein